MWQPDPGWEPLPGGAGPSTLGLWRTGQGETARVVKRLLAPGPDDPVELADPHHPAFWRREADLAACGVLEGLPGLRAPAGAVVEDAGGVTVTWAWVEASEPAPTVVARALARLTAVAAERVGPVPLGRDQLRRRLARTEARGGWPTLARTSAGEVAATLWRERDAWLDRVDSLPQVLVHGDATPANLRGRDGDDVVAVDWGGLGTGPVGADLGFHALAARTDLLALVHAHCAARPGHLRVDGVLLGARVTLAYTALSRAEWALARVDRGEGDLTAKLRHPAVASVLRSLTRHAEDLGALVDASGRRVSGRSEPASGESGASAPVPHDA